MMGVKTKRRAYTYGDLNHDAMLVRTLCDRTLEDDDHEDWVTSTEISRSPGTKDTSVLRKETPKQQYERKDGLFHLFRLSQ